jgi:hypothetical protein
MSRVRAAARFLALSLVASAAVAGIGFLVAVARDTSVRDGVAYALWIVGAFILLVVGLAGSPSRNLAQGRPVLDGPMGGAVLPQTPFGYALIGFVMVGIGVLVYVLD